MQTVTFFIPDMWKTASETVAPTTYIYSVRKKRRWLTFGTLCKTSFDTSVRQLCTYYHITATLASSLSATCCTAEDNHPHGQWSTLGGGRYDWLVLCIGCPDSIPARYRQQTNLAPSEAISQTPHISSESFIVRRTDRQVSMVKVSLHFLKNFAACLGAASNCTYRD